MPETPKTETFLCTTSDWNKNALVRLTPEMWEGVKEGRNLVGMIYGKKVILEADKILRMN